MPLFAPSKETVWQQLADELGGDYFTDGFWLGESKVRAQVDEWVVTLDTYRGPRGTKRTRLRAPFADTRNFTFTVYRAGSFADRVSMNRQDIEIGAADFDESFIIQSNDVKQVKLLFGSPRIRRSLSNLPDVYFHVKNDEGWFNAEFPQGVDELCLETRGEIKDLDRLKELYDLFGETLTRLTEIGEARERGTGIVI